MQKCQNAKEKNSNTVVWVGLEVPILYPTLTILVYYMLTSCASDDLE